MKILELKRDTLQFVYETKEQTLDDLQKAYRTYKEEVDAFLIYAHMLEGTWTHKLETIQAFKETLDLPFIVYHKKGETEDKDFHLFYKALMETKLCNTIMLDLFMKEEMLESIVSLAKKHGIKVILCSIVENAPTKDQIMIRYQAMQRMGADVALQQIHVERASEALDAMQAMNAFELWKAKIPFVMNIDGDDDAYHKLLSYKNGGSFCVVSNMYTPKQLHRLKEWITFQ